MKWHKIYTFTFFFFLLVIFLRAQTNQEFVAKIGDEIITSDQFKTRYEFTPHAGQHIAETKKQFLFTIIAEKLWANEARREGLDNKPIIKSTINAIKKMFARDKLYREEIMNKVVVTDAELASAVEKELLKLSLQYLKSDNKKEMDNLHYLLSGGYSFDSLLVKRPEYFDQQNDLSLKYSEMNQFIVDSVYNLKVGEFTNPINIGDEWFIFYLKNKETQFFPNSEGKNSVVKTARDKVEEDKTALLYKEYMEKMFVGRNVKVDAKLFNYIADKFSALLKEKPSENDTLYFDGNDAYYLTQNIPPDTLSLPFIMLDNEPVAVGDFIRELSFYGFETSSYEKEIVQRDLNLKIRQYIEYEVLAREGIRRGFANLPEVQNDIKMWEDYYLSYYYRNSIKDSISVSEEELKEFALEENEKQRSIFEYKVIELLTNDLNVVKEALTIEDENQFRKFALENTKRSSAKNNNGELDWFSNRDYPVLSQAADELAIGQVYGPIQIGNDYSVIKLIGKRQVQETIDNNADKRNSHLRYLLKEKKYSDALINKTVKFADEHGLQINEEVLNSVPITTINAYLIRLMGFGGQLPAVPLSNPFYEWYKEYLNQDKISL